MATRTRTICLSAPLRPVWCFGTPMCACHCKISTAWCLCFCSRFDARCTDNVGLTGQRVAKRSSPRAAAPHAAVPRSLCAHMLPMCWQLCHATLAVCCDAPVLAQCPTRRTGQYSGSCQIQDGRVHRRGNVGVSLNAICAAGIYHDMANPDDDYDMDIQKSACFMVSPADTSKREVNSTRRAAVCELCRPPCGSQCSAERSLRRQPPQR
jgi:hypothetical protein